MRGRVYATFLYALGQQVPPPTAFIESSKLLSPLSDNHAPKKRDTLC